ncbi:molybdopterin synthase subunit MoaE [Andreprevotia lacus DSM 23236]|jgi:molybdopterin synthase catalytic subunit|uniref:Molybdopterin synthase catalytic subunit n=1 Tax=Andreprevotia lacus DSM 23236 TaxID=1121001 RepID=A0A1W1XWW8_9NEIS|nr:molybdenum cofactor biosynthesis protein MoaE [Andreprevotia lacus]SMC28433.1 molybdopterin synthase subunit MoaE [Andreprevotia lacus DSM 23236]
MADIHVRVQHDDFSLDAELARLADPLRRCGAIASFVGQVRNDPAGNHALTALTLEHYPGMTERSLHALASDAAVRFALDAVVIIHRIGTLQPGERIVLALTAAAHRKAALHAVDYLMDHLKSTVPFWKQEHHGAQHRWVDAKHADDAALQQWQAHDAAR